jgi:very-short-patch-repair endonuclease
VTKICISAKSTIGELAPQLWAAMDLGQSSPERELCFRLFTGVVLALLVGRDAFGAIEIQPQAHRGEGYRLDFLVTVNGKEIAFECDGLAFHSSQTEFARDRKRDRDLAAIGIETYRFTAAEIIRDPVGIQQEAYNVILRAFGAQP